MKKLLLQLCMLASVSTAFGQNALLQGSTTGTISSSSFADLCMVSDGTHAALLVADMSSVYAIDIADNNAGEAAANTVTTIPNFVADKLNPLVGQSVTVIDMVVNPISKSVYILGSAGANKVIFKVAKNGADVSLVDLSNVTYSKMDWGSALNINDMAYADGKLYVSTGTFTLDGSLGWVSSPFAHNGSFSKRSTTLFKSNWGGSYFTTAPLETLTIGKIDGTNRLMGVTTCAPGFSIDVNTLSGSGLLSVTEDFNIHQGQSKKAIYMHHDGKDWLFDLHDSKLYRIGKKYLDGSQVTANKYDNNSTLLRDNSGNVKASLPEEEIKLMSGTTTLSMIAFWDNWSILLLESGATGALTRSKMSVENPSDVSNVVTTQQIEIYPNPAHNNVTVNLPNNNASGTIQVINMNGSVATKSNVNGKTATIDISSLSTGIYTLTVELEDGTSISEKLTVE
ncbi:MAG: T9SS type A sorting domain-containing protein [Chitinophagales bacterium]|nr:T9SS type A sorting domain-containing protein [Chitinophagaceae bacterium]MCB9063982.1 T9SS type A sorting domain-containing protein [Chitinophagales bacterium]